MIRITFEILRRSSADDPPYVQTFPFETEHDTTVTGALDHINAELPPDRQIYRECGCEQQQCGACAMLINGTPRLACGAWLSSFKGEKITLAPLSKFPVIRDLAVDRSAISDALIRLGAWSDNAGTGDIPDGAARCIRCGCCLEVCPNYCPGGGFYGAPALAAVSRLAPTASGEHRKKLHAAYYEHFYNGCGNSLACKKVCPVGIDTEALIVRANAAAVWKKRGGNLF